MKAILTVGISASGKSTFARKWLGDNILGVEINRDAIRTRLAESNGGKFSWEKWNWKREGEVTQIQEDVIKMCASMKSPIIISDTNLNPKTRKALTSKLTTLGYEVEIIDFPITLEEAWKRDAARENGVGHSVIARQYAQWLEYKGRKTYVPDVTKPKCILVDIDGTLAHMNGKRGAFEWDKVGVDDIDHSVRIMVAAYRSTGNLVIVLSGRDGCCSALTHQWLAENDVQYNKLIMRVQGDMRKDTIVKEEIFWRDIAYNYNVQFVIDDRPCVVRLWQEIGLKTFAVGNQHIEF